MIGLLAVTAALGGPMHPDVVLRDAEGADVLASGRPYHPGSTCGGCHDVAFIEDSAGHAHADAAQLAEGDAAYGGVVDPEDVARWASVLGARHVGGGPLAVLGVPMDCLLCHLDDADPAARAEALSVGAWDAVSTATLGATALATWSAGDGVTWHPDAFVDGRMPGGWLTAPRSEACGACHGTVHRSRAPLRAPDGARSVATGLVYSGQRIDQSALNLVDKADRDRSWDVHAERLLECRHCHFPVNHPAYREASGPAHLRFDPRAPALSDYLHRPSHALASERSGPEAMRRCEGCHAPEQGHDWLPNLDRHVAALACESCHIPDIAWSPRQQLDATALDADGAPLTAWRHADGPPHDPATLSAGYVPILLLRPEPDGSARLAPYHLSTVWGWRSGDAPVPRDVLRAVWADVGPLLPAFDADGDGVLSDVERRLDAPDKVARVAEALRARGVRDPQIAGWVDADPVSHGVARGRHVTRACTACHSEASRLDAPMEVARWVPGGVMPGLRGAAADLLSPDHVVRRGDAFDVVAHPRTGRRYVFGADRHPWVDRAGWLALGAALAFAGIHGGLRVLAGRRGAGEAP